MCTPKVLFTCFLLERFPSGQLFNRMCYLVEFPNKLQHPLSPKQMQFTDRRRRVEQLKHSTQQIRKMVTEGTVDQIAHITTQIKRTLQMDTNQTNSTKSFNSPSAFLILETKNDRQDTDRRSDFEPAKKNPTKQQAEQPKQKLRKKSVHIFDPRNSESELLELRQAKLALESEVKELSSQVELLREENTQLRSQSPYSHLSEKLSIFCTRIFVRPEDYERVDFTRHIVNLEKDRLEICKEDAVWRAVLLGNIKEVKYFDLRMMVEFHDQQKSDYVFLEFENREQMRRWDFAMFVNRFVLGCHKKDRLFWMKFEVEELTGLREVVREARKASISGNAIAVQSQQQIAQAVNTASPLSTLNPPKLLSKSPSPFARSLKPSPSPPANPIDSPKKPRAVPPPAIASPQQPPPEDNKLVEAKHKRNQSNEMSMDSNGRFPKKPESLLMGKRGVSPVIEARGENKAEPKDQSRSKSPKLDSPTPFSIPVTAIKETQPKADYQKVRDEDIEKEIMLKKKWIRQRKEEERIEFKPPTDDEPSEKTPPQNSSPPTKKPLSNLLSQSPNPSSLYSPSPNQNSISPTPSSSSPFKMYPISATHLPPPTDLNESSFLLHEPDNKKVLFEALRKPKKFVKYAKGGLKPREKDVYMAENEEELCWRDTETKKVSKIKVEEIMYILVGQLGEGMKKHEDKKRRLDVRGCVIIKTDDKVIELYNEDRELVKSFVRDLEAYKSLDKSEK